MNKINFYDLFEKLNIQVEKLPSNYSPEIYGRELMTNVQRKSGVSYSSETVVRNTQANIERDKKI